LFSRRYFGFRRNRIVRHCQPNVGRRLNVVFIIKIEQPILYPDVALHKTLAGLYGPPANDRVDTVTDAPDRRMHFIAEQSAVANVDRGRLGPKFINFRRLQNTIRKHVPVRLITGQFLESGF